MSFTVKRFEFEKDENQWNSFLKKAKNQNFLLNRGFMDYHKHKFTDHSLMLYNEKGNLAACFPANESDEDEITSHQGLTYGSLIVHKETKLPDFISIFKEILKYYNDILFKKIILKKFPDIYNVYPSNEIDYVLFLTDALKISMKTAIAINQEHKLKLQNRRKRGVKKAAKKNTEIKIEADVSNFYNKILLPNLLKKYGAEPIHSLEELQSLMDKFPNNIVQYSAYLEGEIMAGATIFLSEKVAHAQYISASDLGRENGSLDFLFYHLIHDHCASNEIFDFGSCNEEDGRKLNLGLLNWKEGFGARCYAQDVFKIETANFKKLEDVYN